MDRQRTNADRLVIFAIGDRPGRSGINRQISDLVQAV
jgi:hypothetical protein